MLKLSKVDPYYLKIQALLRVGVDEAVTNLSLKVCKNSKIK